MTEPENAAGHEPTPGVYDVKGYPRTDYREHIEEKYSEYTEDLSDEWREAFYKLVGRGRSPPVVRAAIEYTRTEKTQDEVVREWDVSKVGLRRSRRAVFDVAPEGSELKWRCPAKKHKTDFAEAVADELGWEHGEHYHRTNLTVSREGWLTIYNALGLDGESGDGER